ncbi:MAG: biotin--[acetyl-CoA-carboxylase] ligase [Candidatus Omnitrophota bacterium]
MEEKILKYLKQNMHNFVSGQELSERLNVSRTAIWKHIKNLKNLDYQIIAQPHSGYQLLKIPDKMLPEEISDNLKTKKIAKKIIAYKSTDSTNNIAYRLAEDGALHGTIVVSEAQSKGKGRLGRSWVSPAGVGIYLSIILRPNISPLEAGKLTLMSSVSLVRALKQVLDINAQIKWPNDIYVDNEKVCGILTEMSAEVDQVNFIILGIGLNVNTKASDLPKGGTSLQLKLKDKKHIDRVSLLKSILEAIEADYLKVLKYGFNFVVEQWKKSSRTLGHDVKIKTGKKVIYGKALDLDNNGALVICDDTGSLQHILSGDVTPMDSR